MSVQTNLERFRSRKWGIFTHFLGGDNAETWRRRVDAVDVNHWAEQLAELGAGFFGITMMQVCHTMLAPNAAYDRITGYKPGEACATRDLVLELSDALRKYDIDLMLYFTGDGPCRDIHDIANRAFGFTTPRLVDGHWVGKQEPQYPPESFVDKWCQVLREYADRYGDRVLAWWFDGCYRSLYPDEVREDYLGRYKAAVRAANPDVLTTFNGGFNNEKNFRHSIHDDFTCGETGELLPVPADPLVDGVQWFEFLCNGHWWKEGDRSSGIWKKTGDEPLTVRFTPDDIYHHVKAVSDAGGVVMFNVNLVNGDRDIHPGQFHAMSRLRELR